MKHLTLLFILLFSFSVFGQNKPVLTNESVIELVRANISDAVIIAKIRSSNVNFDTSNDALILLKDKNVSDNVQAAMFERAADMEAQAAQDGKIEITTDAPENGSLSEIADKTNVYFSTDDTEARDIMMKELSKYSGLQSVDTPEKANFVLVYAIVGNKINGNFIGKIGELYAFTRGSKNAEGKTRIRIHYSVRKTQETVFDLNPAKSTMRNFIDDFKKARSK